MQVNWEWILNRTSMVVLIGGGLFFIIEGAGYIDMKRKQPSKIPDKMYAVGIMTIILGVLSLIFGILHFVFPT